MTDIPEEPIKYPRGRHPNTLAAIKDHAWKKGQVMNPSGRRTERTIDGVKVSKVFNDHLGPMSIKVIEKKLTGALNKSAQEITKIEIELARFVAEKVYGKAELNVNVNGAVATVNPYVTSNLSVEQMEAILNSVTVDAVVREDDSPDDEESGYDG